ncbi:F-box domain protein [Mycena venus]|uniref:F-box domain protein n=1 Tax=Mycena venus TaxID=2733690 RepID=A0A8H7CV24_9AGAR|nr:F-box domain protein [Mycena venus]
MAVDVLCAVCGGPTVQVQIAKKSPKVRVPRNESNSEGLSPHSEDSNPDSDEDEWGYDPQIVNEEDVEWTGSCILLGYNKRSTAIDKMYLTGRSTYQDFGHFNVDPSEDPNFPEDDPHSQCFVICDATQTSCYPIHQPCLQLLAKVLCRDANIENLDKDHSLPRHVQLAR